MTTKTIECVECGQPVPNGRLSCPACGALRAAVSRSRRAPVPPASPPAATSTYLIDPAEPTGAGPEPDDWQTPWPPLRVPDPVLVARPYGRAGPGEGADAGIAAPPGAYLPPSLAPSMAMAGTAQRSWTMPAGGAGGASAASAAGGAGGAVGVGSTEGHATAIGVIPGVDAPRLVEIAGWFVVVGSAMAALGFLLPWSLAVIGARGSGGYLDHWGLASPSHVLVLAGLLAVMALGVVRTTVPAWVRTGVVGLGAGGLLIGLTWPYIFGPLGSDIGVLVVALGGVALVIGGGVASWATRHAGADPVV